MTHGVKQWWEAMRPPRPPAGEQTATISTARLARWGRHFVRSEQVESRLPAELCVASISSWEEVIATDADGHPFEAEICLPKRTTLRHTFDHLSSPEAEKIAARIERAPRAMVGLFKVAVAETLMAAYRKCYRNTTHVLWAFIIATIFDGLGTESICTVIRSDYKYKDLYDMIEQEFLVERDAMRISQFSGPKSEHALRVMTRHIEEMNFSANVLAHCIAVGCAAAIVFWEDGGDQVDKQCIACCERMANLACVPCGHMVMCVTCASKTAALHREHDVEQEALFRCPVCMASVVKTEPPI